MCRRITLEDDDEDEDLGVETAPRRPVLVMSDSLKEGLQRSISDILPHTVAQSVYVLRLLFKERTRFSVTFPSRSSRYVSIRQSNVVFRWSLKEMLSRCALTLFSSTLSGAIPAWSWCCGGPQRTTSVADWRAHYRNSANNRLYLVSPRLRVHLPPLPVPSAPPALLQTRTLHFTATLRPTAPERRTWRCDDWAMTK